MNLRSVHLDSVISRNPQKILNTRPEEYKTLLLFHTKFFDENTSEINSSTSLAYKDKSLIKKKK